MQSIEELVIEVSDSEDDDESSDFDSDSDSPSDDEHDRALQREELRLEEMLSKQKD